MMKITMCFFHTREIAARVITDGLPCAGTMLLKNIRVIGRRAKSAATVLIQKIMCGTAPMRTILRNCLILPNLIRRIVSSVRLSLAAEKTDIRNCRMGNFCASRADGSI